MQTPCAQAPHSVPAQRESKSIGAQRPSMQVRQEPHGPVDSEQVWPRRRGALASVTPVRPRPTTAPASAPVSPFKTDRREANFRVKLSKRSWSTTRFLLAEINHGTGSIFPVILVPDYLE